MGHAVKQRIVSQKLFVVVVASALDMGMDVLLRLPTGIGLVSSRHGDVLV